MGVSQMGGQESGLDTLLSAPAGRSIATVTVQGTGETESELSLPYHGQRLRGDALLHRLEQWTNNGVIQPSCAHAVRAVAEHPDWLCLSHRTIPVPRASSLPRPLPA